ncbi:MAG TPA: hypothetical protein PLL09_13375 [Flavobacterium sp.]|uniref:hypothetical protein n=1 Tax=unclassified Flavobacterium TaxID=196869 RepID=UPI000E9B2E5B|nr:MULTISPECIES: hypothetical protein [unclassified Flavobacterium]HBI01580.1 hypothetical protein [Flavobacterium sp.]HRE78802.1 hypothetical protein [Flavobacterium sp.]
MKIYKIFFLLALALFVSCTSDDDSTPVNELDGLLKVKEFTNDTHVVELYTTSGITQQGYNDITLRIKDKTTNNYIQNATIEWMPVMHMTMMSHSCPFSMVEKVAGKETLYNGYIVFQMPQNSTEYWDLKVDYSINGTNYTVTDIIDVPASSKRVVNSFMGTDNIRYIVALIDPKTPRVALNDMTVGIFKMENMMSFPVVNDLKLMIDPRMPSMGNHGSPNNVDLTQSTSDEFYHGKLSLTMTGYWKINLQLVNASNDVLKGETVTESNEASSIFFEVEF